MANQNTFGAPAAGAGDFKVNLGNQWTGSVEYFQATTFGFFAHGLRDAVGRKNDDVIVWYFIQLIHKNSAALFQSIYHKLVMHHFVANIDRWLKNFQRPFNNGNGSVYTGTKATGIS